MPFDRILVAGMNYRDYDTQICRAIEARGISCVQLKFPARGPTAGYPVPGLANMSFALSKRRRQAECQSFMSKVLAILCKDGFDAVLFINPVFLLDAIDRSSVPPIFSWFMDPVWRYPQFERAVAASRLVFSYDERDCKSHGLRYLPLFATASRPKPVERDIDFCFIGALYFERLATLNRVREFAEKSNRRIYFGGDLHAPVRLTLPLLRARYGKLMNSFQIGALTQEECLAMYNRSKCVLNFHAAGHHGHSMRTFEALLCEANVLMELSATGLLARHRERLFVAQSVHELTDELLEVASTERDLHRSSEAISELGLDARMRDLLAGMEACL